MSSTMPPDQPTEPTSTPPPRPAGGITIGTADIARLPMPGNAEFLVYILALIVAWLVVWPADDLTAGSWVDFFKWATAAYLISRGISKASRVLEH
jgi:hypothetical protein